MPFIAACLYLNKKFDTQTGNFVPSALNVNKKRTQVLYLYPGQLVMPVRSCSENVKYNL
jgi:hypothetical protein